MNVLIVYAHEEEKSFNNAMKNTAIGEFEKKGWEVKVSDLYKINFNSVGSRNDFQKLSNNSHVVYQVEQKIAFENDDLLSDINYEIKKIKWADLIIFQFPIWWFSMPAIMKGWVDRVFVNGDIYAGGKWYSNGVLRGKKALISMTTGGPESAFAPNGMNGYMKDILFPITHGVFSFTGMDALEPYIVYGPAYMTQEERTLVLDNYKKELGEIETRSFNPPLDLAEIDENCQFINK